MSNIRLGVGLVLALCVSTASAQAAPVTFMMRGTVDAFTRGGTIDTIPVGSEFWMSLTWDTEVPASADSTPELGTYYGAVTAGAVRAAGVEFALSPTDGTSTLSVGNGLDFDRLIGSIIDESATSSEADLNLWRTRWELLFPSSTWSDTSLPTEVSSLVDGLAKLTIYSRQVDHDIRIEATVTTAHTVPEPSTLMLLGMGLAGAFRLRRSGGAQSSV